MFELQGFSWPRSFSSRAGRNELLKKCSFDTKTSILSSASILSIVTLLLTQEIGATISEVTSPPWFTKQPPNTVILFQVAEGVEETKKPFIIDCVAEGNPAPQYTWFKNGNELDTQYRFRRFDWKGSRRIVQQPGRGSLVVTDPRDEDIGQYQCFATNSFGTATSNLVILRKAELNSFKDEEIVQTIIAEEGKPFSLPCNVPPSGWDKPIVDWVLQSTQGAIKSINSSRITVDPEGTLWFSNVTKEDKSMDFNYVCSAYSRFRHEYNLGNRVYLYVNPITSSSTQNELAPMQQYMSKSTTIGMRGETLELWCIVGGTPVPEIRWERLGARLPHDRVTFRNYGKTIRISDTTWEDAGTYGCHASNGVGQPVSYSINVIVKSSPYFEIEPESTTVAEEATVEFKCTAGGAPAPIIRWIHNGKPIEEAAPNPRRTLDGDTIVIRNISKLDTGNYGCSASNLFGYVYKDVYVNVIDVERGETDPGTSWTLWDILTLF